MGMVVLLVVVAGILFPAALRLRRGGPRSGWGARLYLHGISMIGLSVILGSGHAIAHWRAGQEIEPVRSAIPVVAGGVLAAALVGAGAWGVPADPAPLRGRKSLASLALAGALAAVVGAYLGGVLGAPPTVWALVGGQLAGITLCVGALFVHLAEPA